MSKKTTEGIKMKKKLEGQTFISRSFRQVLPYALYDFIKCVRIAMKSKGPFYSQNNEDSILLEYFPERKGTYIDIGSGNPKYLSNTYAFYKRGWDGYLFDPIKSNILASKIFRSRDVIKRNFVGTEHTEQMFFQLEPSYFSTSEPLVVEYWIAQGAQLVRQYKTETISIKSLNFICRPSDPVFFSIDTEGSELEVLKSIDFERQLPRAIVLETWDSDKVSNVSECTKILIKNGYGKISNNNENDIWIHESYKMPKIQNAGS